MYDYAANLTKIEKELAKARAKVVQLGEDLENCIRLALQAKQNYDEEIAGLSKELVILENKMGQQVKYFKIEREHCYNVLNQLEGNSINLQNQRDQALLLVEARKEQIRLMCQNQTITKFRIWEIADYTARKCNKCEDMTKDMFFDTVLDFARKVMANLQVLHAEIGARPTQ